MPKSSTPVKKKKGEKEVKEAEPEPEPIREPEERAIKIRAGAINNLNKGKSQNLVTEVKVIIEFMGNILGESKKIQVTEDEFDSETLVNLEVSLWCNPSKQESLDKIVANPLLFTISEGNPKGPKGETSGVVGQCNLDLLPLVLGELTVQEDMLVELAVKSMGQNLVSWPNLPRLSASADIEEPLLSPEELEDINILYVTLGSMHYSLPTMTNTMQYSAATIFPLWTDKHEDIRFENGFLCSTMDVEKTKRWIGLSNLQGRSAYTKYMMSEEEVKCNLPIDVQAKLNENIPRIEWNALRRCLISKKAGRAIFDTLNKYQCWAIEIMITQAQGQRSAVKTKSKDSPSENLHLMAFLNLTTLVYPGVTHVSSAAQVATFNQKELTERFGLEKSLFEEPPIEEPKKENNSGSKPKKDTSAGSKQKGETSGGSKQKKSDNNKSPMKLPPEVIEVPEPESELLVTAEGNPVFIIMEIDLFKPLVLKRSIEYLESQMAEVIPPRPELPKQVMSAELASKHYTFCIQTMADTISKEYQKFIASRANVQKCSNVFEDTKNDFYFYLCAAGVYQELLEMLRNKISILIRERCEFGRNIMIQKDKQNFISEVYIYLVEEMHMVINNLLETECQKTPYTLTCEQLYLFAIEANEEGNFQQANKLLLERIALDKKNPDYWIDYGILCLEQGLLDKAKECIKEALLIDSRHKTGLFMYSILLALSGEYDIAEIFLEALTYFYPTLAEAWVTFHLFYLRIENYQGADVTLYMANKCFKHKKYIIPFISTNVLAWSHEIYGNDSVFLITAISLLKLHCTEFAETALAQELIHNGHSVPYLYYLSVSHYLEKRYEDAISHITSAVREHGKRDIHDSEERIECGCGGMRENEPSETAKHSQFYIAQCSDWTSKVDYCLWSLMGHCYYKLENKTKSMDCYQHVAESYDRPRDIHLTTLRLGTYYLEEESYKTARNTFLDACHHSPSPETWLGVGIACYRLGKFQEAEMALTEANMLDNKSPIIWAYLTLLNLQYERQEEFQLCYRQCIRHNLEDETILEEIKEWQDILEFPDPVVT